MLTILPRRAQWDPLRSLIADDINDSTFTIIGTPYGDNPSVMLFQNFTDVTIDFSDDPTVSAGKFQLASGGQFVLDIAGNSLLAPIGNAMWAKGSPTTGQVNVSIVYGQN